jgi:Fur family ferric uptake transcriptional regulator
MESMPDGSHLPDTDDVHLLAATRLAARDQRYTPNRRRLVDALAASAGPLTLTGILGDGDGMAQSSAYRNLAVLEEAGVVLRIVTSDDHARYELTEIITGQHHHHLVCDRCGDIVDVTLPADLEATLDTSLTAEADRVGFVGRHHRVDLVGHCQDCADRAPR